MLYQMHLSRVTNCQMSGTHHAFGMAKGTIREAMRILEAQGLVKTRTGQVVDVLFMKYQKLEHVLCYPIISILGTLTISDIYQLRKQLEPELAADLAGKLDAAAIGELEAITEEYETPPRARKMTDATTKPLFAFMPDLPPMLKIISWALSLALWLRSYPK